MKLHFKSFLIIILFITTSFNSYSQRIEGLVIDSKTKESLSYVNIGVLNSAMGTITNENGQFELNCNNISENSEVRISMIGYKSKSYLLKQLLKENNIIALNKDVFELKEIVVEYDEALEKKGTIKSNTMASVCGWGGTQFGRGHELGLAIDLGEKPVKIEDLNLKVYKQSFDSTMCRIHLRKLEKNIPGKELLTENIFLNITEVKGWEKINLSKYNIVTAGKIVLTLEWIKVSSVVEDRLVKMNGSKQGTPNVLFKLNTKTGTLFMRHGSDASWIIKEEQSPVFYITTRGEAKHAAL